MGIKDRLVRALALRWVRGKLDKARERGSAMWKFMDGRKRLWVVIVVLLAAIVKTLTGVDVSQWVDLGLRAVGWTDPEMIEFAKRFATEWALEIAALIASGHALYKHWRERKAGAARAEVGTFMGQYKRAMVEGKVTLPPDAVALTHGPNTIMVDGHPFAVPAQEAR